MASWQMLRLWSTILNDDFKEMWDEVVVAYLKMVFVEENHEILSQIASTVPEMEPRARYCCANQPYKCVFYGHGATARLTDGPTCPSVCPITDTDGPIFMKLCMDIMLLEVTPPHYLLTCNKNHAMRSLSCKQRGPEVLHPYKTTGKIIVSYILV
jgi:hypothetical protein